MVMHPLAWRSTHPQQGCSLLLYQPHNPTHATGRSPNASLKPRQNMLINNGSVLGSRELQTLVVLDSNMSTAPPNDDMVAGKHPAKRYRPRGSFRNNKTSHRVKHNAMIASNPRQLTALLTSASSQALLLQLLREHEEMLNVIHISAALVRAARLAGQKTSHSDINYGADTQQVNQLLISFCQAWLLSPSDSQHQQAASSCVIGINRGSDNQPTGQLCRLHTCSIRELANISWALAKQGTGHGLAIHVCYVILTAAKSSPTVNQAVKCHSNQSIPDDSMLDEGWAVAVSLPPNPIPLPNQQKLSTLHALTHRDQTTINTSHQRNSDEIVGHEGQQTQEIPRVTVNPCMRKHRTGRSQLQTATPQAIVNLLWSFARWFPDVCLNQANPLLEQRPASNSRKDQPDGHDSRIDIVSAEGVSQGNTLVDSPMVTGVQVTNTEHHRPSNTELCDSLEALSLALLQKIQLASPQDLALATWSLGTLQFRPQQCALLPAMVNAFTDSCEHQTCQGLSNFTHGLVHLLQPNEQLPAAAHEAIGKRIIQLAGQLAALPQETAVLMRSLALLGHSSPMVWRTVQAQVGETHLQMWSGHTLSLLITAYASANRPCMELIEALHSALGQAGQPQAHGTINEQCSTNHGKHSVQVERMDSTVHPGKRRLQTKGRRAINIQCFATQDLVMMMWSLASLYRSTARANSSESNSLEFVQQDQSEQSDSKRSNKRHGTSSRSHAGSHAMIAGGPVDSSLTMYHSTGAGPLHQTESLPSSTMTVHSSHDDASDPWQDNQTGCITRDIIQSLASEMYTRMQAEKLEPRLVALTAWASHICETDHPQLVNTCADHAASNLKRYKGREVVAILQAGQRASTARLNIAVACDVDTPTPGKGPTPDYNSDGSQGKARQGNVKSDDCQNRTAVVKGADAWSRLWRAINHAGPVFLPGLRHTELSALLRYAVHAGEADRQLLTWVVQLVLGAVAQRARRLKQQQLAEAGAMLFSDVELQGPDRTPQHDMHEERRVGTARTTADAVKKHICLSHAASDSKHMPNARSLADITWAVSVSGFRSPQLFQLINVMCGNTAGASQLSPDRAIKLMYACVHAGWYSKDLFDALCGQICIHLGSLSSKDMVEALGMLAASRHSDEWLVSELCARLQTSPTCYCSPDQMVMVMWAVARLNAGVMLQWQPPVRELLCSVPNLSLPALILLLWSLAVQQHVLLTPERRSMLHHSHSSRIGSQPVASKVEASLNVSEGFGLLRAVLQQINITLAANNSHVLDSNSNNITVTNSSVSNEILSVDSILKGAEYGVLLPQSLSWLLHSKDSDIVYEVTKTLAAWTPDVTARLHALRLDSNAAVKVLQQASSISHSSQCSTSFNIHSCIELTSTHMGAASRAVKFARVQLHRQLTQLGFSSVLTEKLQTAPSSSAFVYAPEVHEARATCPASIPGLVLLPTASPKPVAIVVAPSGSFARNRPAEPMGWLFMTMTLLSEAGWQPVIVDVRNWHGLRGDSHQKRFVSALLRKWGSPYLRSSQNCKLFVS